MSFVGKMIIGCSLFSAIAATVSTIPDTLESSIILIFVIWALFGMVLLSQITIADLERR